MARKSIPTMTAEMALAVPQVVAHRLTRMALAGTTPSARDQKEFQRMGTEKVWAFYESWGAMYMQAAKQQQQWMTSMMFPWAGMPAGKKAGKQLGNAAAAILESGMKPVHGKAVANAKRLSRTKLK
ncbi:polyhydroxyalkanoate granule-associated phasin [Candidatus Thiothrix sp. Deng01]|uniref:Polyhydroxyalkanoate granule-associated phasin n=1 Tax=Candidatus Thiothrix phosphatis TaxID=3112415 RepID=A0ABU6D2V2_9GAMM|nr:polyhydroxyalkanoate granule-associated phasin [Candidatus Thiothrix sp. Deng01]MEB4593121.1 polyhydroxyalkanoate granule-associated phasin [Candidatus Thiothrix sp. Deng01]